MTVSSITGNDSTYIGGVSNGAGGYYTSRSGATGCISTTGTTSSIFNNAGGAQYTYGLAYESMYNNRKEAEIWTNKATAEELVRQQGYTNIQDALKEGREDEASELIDEAVAQLKAQGNDLPEDQLMQLVMNEYTQITGTALDDDVKKYADSSFASTFEKFALWGNGDSTTQEQLVSKITGREDQTTGASKFFGGLFGTVGALVGWIPALFGARG